MSETGSVSSNKSNKKGITIVNSTIIKDKIHIIPNNETINNNTTSNKINKVIAPNNNQILKSNDDGVDFFLNWLRTLNDYVITNDLLFIKIHTKELIKLKRGRYNVKERE
ncbi:MAG: hypothetical protein [Cotesia congregata filamentous virus 2]